MPKPSGRWSHLTVAADPDTRDKLAYLLDHYRRTVGVPVTASAAVRRSIDALVDAAERVESLRAAEGPEAVAALIQSEQAAVARASRWRQGTATARDSKTATKPKRIPQRPTKAVLSHLEDRNAPSLPAYPAPHRHP